MLLTFFTYPQDRVIQTKYVTRICDALGNNLWKVGEISNLMLTILSGAESYIETLGILSFIQNGVAGNVKYFGSSFPRWFVFCHLTIESQSLSFVTVQWTPYSQGFSILIQGIGEKWITEGKHDID